MFLEKTLFKNMVWYISLSLSTYILACGRKYTAKRILSNSVLIFEAWNSVGDTVCVLEP